MTKRTKPTNNSDGYKSDRPHVFQALGDRFVMSALTLFRFELFVNAESRIKYTGSGIGKN